MNARAAATIKPRVRIRWTAGDAAGLAHAHRALWPARTACGLRAIAELFAWPTRALCPLCVAVVESEGVA